MGAHEAALLEEHLRQRIEALREDQRGLRDALRQDLRDTEARLLKQIDTNSGRLTTLERWQDQMVGASKAGKLVWTGLAALMVSAFALYTWIYEHFRH